MMQKVVRKRVLLIVTAVTVLVIASCDKGLSPPAVPSLSNQFPVEPLGVNPVGQWTPRAQDPVDITILDDSQIPAVVDSMFFRVALDGGFEFTGDGDCRVAALMTIDAQVYLQDSPTPLQFTFPDSITGEGPYYIIDDTILETPIRSTLFNLDTLGFTSAADALQLISLPNVFSYLGIIEVPIYMIFHLARADEIPPGAARSQVAFRTWRRKAR